MPDMKCAKCGKPSSLLFSVFVNAPGTAPKTTAVQTRYCILCADNTADN